MATAPIRVWHYCVPHTHDVVAAFRELQRDVFRHHARTLGYPTLDDVLTRAGLGETGTILDMRRVGVEPATQVCAPLTAAQMWAVFGTLRPRKDAVDLDALPLRSVNEGSFCVVYDDDDEPACLLWWGSSQLSER